uniref:RRM domain-containing protein n=1 Tax=Trichogramma kaykai TaxID=54128 RepID=A0ABD2WZG5_9HYME
MTSLLHQLAYQYEAEKQQQQQQQQQLQSEVGLDAPGSPASPQAYRQPQQLTSHRDEMQQQQQQQADRDYVSQQRENKMQLQSHEREQHLRELSSLNNLLLDLPTVPSSPTYNAAPGSKFSIGHELVSPTSSTSPSKSVSNGNLDATDMSISDLFGLGSARGSLMSNNQKDHGAQTGFDTSTYKQHNMYYSQQLDRSDNSNGYYSNTTAAEKPYEYSNGYYSNLNQSNSSNYIDTPSSPVSVHTPATPSTPGSMYSNPYSYSSMTSSSSPYNSASSVSSGYNKRFPSSPLRSPPCYARAIRGSPPYSSDCSSPSTEYPNHSFGCNNSRSNSPADSDTSASSIDGPLADIIRRCYPQNPWAEVKKYLHSGRATLADLPFIKKCFMEYCQTQQQPSQQQPQTTQQSTPSRSSQHTPMHNHYHHHQNNNTPSRSYFNQESNNNSFNGSHFGNSEKNCCNMSVPRSNPSLISLDKAARIHRKAAAASDANHTWCGELPQRTRKPIGYSSKVFLGGVPWDTTESILVSTFKQFGPIKIEWPGKNQSSIQPKGYVYIVFESEKQVKSLLACCTHDFSNGGRYYYKISSKRMKGKDVRINDTIENVQVIPWALNDSNFVKSSSQKLDPDKTVFVGALHGMMTATGLSKIMNDLFDNVIYVGIDTDKHKYPIGSCRVTFSSKHSFNKAVNAAFIEVKTAEFRKTIQVDPYIEDAPCSSCYVQQGPYFCRDRMCFKYYCHTCWQWVHSSESMSSHEPMSRGLKKNHVIGLTPNAGLNRRWDML